jgi:hypothetical protein
VLLRDDFAYGLSHRGEAPRWRLRPAGPFPEGDGVVTTGPDGLVVVPTATDPATGAPAFVPQDEPLGDADHMRWAALAARTSSAGFPGFDLTDRAAIVVTARLGVRGYNLDGHPYGDTVPDPRRDLRIGAGLLVTADMETGLVFDFIVTDGCIFAVYERLALPGTDHAAFSYAVPVADRAPDDDHALSVVHDVASATTRWYLEGAEVLAVDRLGHRALDPAHLKRDNGKPEQPASPRQLTCGFGLFTDQIWGQGVRLTVRSIEVRSSSPVAAPTHSEGTHPEGKDPTP